MPDKSVHVRRKLGRGRHPWVFSNEVLRLERGPDIGDTVKVFDRGRFIGAGFYNPNSLIRVRLYSDADEEPDRGFFIRRLRAARDYRAARLGAEQDFRLAFGESDRLPGLVVDKYGAHYVVQTYAAGMDRRRTVVAEALVEAFGAESVYEKNDIRLREVEGLERREGPIWGTPPSRVEIAENGARFLVDFIHGQKTGFYYDQRPARRRVRELARGRRFLDVFCYTGGFAVNAALGGAEEVLAVDGSETAVGIARANAALNRVEGRCRFETEEAFGFLSRLARGAPRFDVICLDPPAFIKSKKERDGGLRGFRNINALAMKSLPPDGILITCSCSHYLFWQDMLDMLVLAARDAGRSFVIAERLTQGPDHPVLLAMPESEYLRGFVLRVV